MRRLFMICTVLAVVAATGAGAWADGPGGSTEHHEGCVDDTTGEEAPPAPDGSCSEGSTAATISDNNVTCGSEDDAAGLDVTAGDDGFEVCNDDGDVPIQGRVLATGDPSTQSGYAGADGDTDNPVPLDGWIGVSSDAGTPVACGQRDGVSLLLGSDDEGGRVERSLEHANSEDDVLDCVGL